MDGVYFNNFKTAKDGDDTKVYRQKKTIEKYLKKNKKNFFVNTAGLLAFLNDLIKYT